MTADARVRFDQLDTSGATTRTIAAELGVSVRTIGRWRSEAGRLRAPAGGKPRPQSDRDLAARLIEDGCSLSEAARTIGCSQHTVTRWFPEAPRYTREQSGYASVLARQARNILAA